MSFAGREEQEFLEKTRLVEQSPEWRNLYQERAGIEGTISQSVRGYGLRQTRYIGKEKTHLHNIAVCFITFSDTDSANYSLQNILPASIGLRNSPTEVMRLFNILGHSTNEPSSRSCRTDC